MDNNIADLEQTIKDLTADLKNLKAQIAEMAVHMKRAGEDIQSIIDDAKAMENEAIVDEENAQKAYEDFVKESTSDAHGRLSSSWWISPTTAAP